jgi:hypothetical protein
MINYAKNAGFPIYSTITIFHQVGYAAESITIRFRVTSCRGHGARRLAAIATASTG